MIFMAFYHEFLCFFFIYIFLVSLILSFSGISSNFNFNILFYISFFSSYLSLFLKFFYLYFPLTFSLSLSSYFWISRIRSIYDHAEYPVYKISGILPDTNSASGNRRIRLNPTVCPRSFDHFVCNILIKWVKTSWTYRTINRIANKRSG